MALMKAAWTAACLAGWTAALKVVQKAAHLVGAKAVMMDEQTVDQMEARSVEHWAR